MFLRSGPGLKEGVNWAVAQGPPQLRGLHKDITIYLVIITIISAFEGG